jgi:hypothetical protein
MDPVPDPPLLRKSGSVGNRTRDLWVGFRVNAVMKCEIEAVTAVALKLLFSGCDAV